MSMQDFIDSSESHETSPDIMEAITHLARSEEEARRIWAEPLPGESMDVFARVLIRRQLGPEDIVWGDFRQPNAEYHGHGLTPLALRFYLGGLKHEVTGNTHSVRHAMMSWVYGVPYYLCRVIGI